MNTISRRQLLTTLGVGGSMILFGGLGERAAYAGPTAPPQRIIFMFTPNGTIAKNFWPVGSDPSASPILKPLAAYKDNLLVVKGLDMLAAMEGPGDAHQKGVGACLTGTTLQPGSFKGDAGTSAGWANGPSVDQAIAKVIGKDTAFPSLELGVQVDGSDVWSRLAYGGAAMPLPPENSPYAAYARVFADANSDPSAAALRDAKRKAVLQRLKQDYTKLSSRLGTEEQQRLQNHLLSLSDLEQRLGRGAIVLGGKCAKPDQGTPVDDVMKVANMPAVGKLQMDLITAAFACDATRVVTLMWTQSRANPVYSWVDPAIREGHHTLAHKGDEDTVKVGQTTELNTWFAKQLAYLADRLKSIPEGNGTLLDNTLIVWLNEQNKGNNHDRHDIPTVILGSAGGKLKTGRFVTVTPSTGHNRLLVTLQNVMGVQGSTFGDAKYGSGALGEITS